MVGCFSQFTYAQSNNKDKKARIHEVATKLYKEGKLHGGVLVAEGENIIYQGAFGMADRDLGVPNTEKTRFIINSMGKMFTAILILQLAEEGQLKVSDPISKHLPWFEHPRAKDITIHQLLSHRSGLKGYFMEQLEGRLEFNLYQRDMLEKMAQTELNFEPDTAFDYCNTGYVLLGEIIMKYRGTTDYNNILQERIFKPLGMKNTYHSASVYGPGAPVYYKQDGSPATPFPHINYKGDGGSKSTLQDLHKFAMAIGSEKLLTKASWNLAFTPHSLPEEAKRVFGAHFDPYGYGYSVLSLPYAKNKKAKAVGHGGAGIGSTDFLVRYTDSERIIINWNNEFLNPVLTELFEAVAEN